MDIRAAVAAHADELLELRRDIHAHPELAWEEHRTTAAVSDRLEQAGCSINRLPRSGVVAELGPEDGPLVVLRADLDALAVEERTGLPFSSLFHGVSHACGHDVHTTALVGAGLALADLGRQEDLPGRIRLLFQPAEEVMPGGALDLVKLGVVDRAVGVFGLHCDPSLDVGQVGLREGPVTGAADAISVRLEGKGGHTSRPHLTQDLTYALGTLVTELPALLSRRLDPRAGASVVWGRIRAGAAHNVIPSFGEAAGTIRMLDAVAWAEAEQLVRELVDQVLAPFGVEADVQYVRGVPPVVNDPHSTSLLGEAARQVVGSPGLVGTSQSLGGEDFAWYLEEAPGAMARLGTRGPGAATYDLHQGDLLIDEGAITIGAAVLASVALLAVSG